jgi:polyphosphate kinase
VHKRKTIARDISWLSFNSRVLQEAEDETVPLKERIKFLGIFSNNLDEFFRVRVATLQRMIEFGSKAKMHLEINPEIILEEILAKVLILQNNFEKAWGKILFELKKNQIFIVNHKQINAEQKRFILNYFNDEIRGNIVPLMIESIDKFPVLNDKSIYLACTLSKKDNSIPKKFALISLPTKSISRFIILPSSKNEKKIILLDDVIRFCLPHIFSFFNYDTFSAHTIKVTRDAEIDIDNDIATSFIQKIEKGLKNRKKGKPVRLVFDKDIPVTLLSYLVKRLELTHKDNLIPGGKIHNFKDFMNFPTSVFTQNKTRKNAITHPELINKKSVSKVIFEKDVMLHFPYHSFNSIIDLMREAAIDPDVMSIKVTCYRLATHSKIINALTNAVRNGKKVTVIIELRARFDEEANLFWKQKLEDAGVTVFIGVPKMKVHAKICLIKKKIQNKFIHYGFISTGNLNERTALTYGDHCLLTSNKSIMLEVNKVFNYLENPTTRFDSLKSCKSLMISPTSMRKEILTLINREIKHATEKKKAYIILKLNSLSDEELVNELYLAAKAGVEVKIIIRGICCMYTENKKFIHPIQAISIVDEYLEHSRVMVFYNNGHEKVFISSADYMIRNLNHRFEIACPILDKTIKLEMLDILNIQLKDNVKARVLNNDQDNQYIGVKVKKKIRSQLEIYKYLQQKSPTS